MRPIAPKRTKSLAFESLEGRALLSVAGLSPHHGTVDAIRAHETSIADSDAGKLLNTVLDSGVTFIDTSIDYGRSEELIGRYISRRRDEYFLASKCCCPLGQFPPQVLDRLFSRAEESQSGVNRFHDQRFHGVLSVCVRAMF